MVPRHRTVANSKASAGGHQAFTVGGTRIEAPRGWGILQPTGGLGERRELPSGVRGGAPAANKFLAYLRPTEEPVKAQFFVKVHSID